MTPHSFIAGVVADTLARWELEAILFCAIHGKRGGKFVTESWADGRSMVGVPDSPANTWIPSERFARLEANGWKFCY